MARSFDGDDRLKRTGAVIGSYPLTIAGWFKTSFVDGGCVASLHGAAGVARKLLYLSSSTVFMYCQDDAAGSMFVAATGSYTTGVWTHACAVFAAANDYRVYRSGANKATSTTNVVFGTPGFTVIGDDEAGTNCVSELAEVGMWNLALSDGDVAELAVLGTDATAVQPGNLVAYWRVLGVDSPETDEIGSADLTVTGTVPSTHPWDPPAVASFDLIGSTRARGPTLRGPGSESLGAKRFG